MDDYLVSIGFPTFNRVCQAKDRITSLLKQTYQNIELIISNNNPDPDDLDEFVRKLQESDKRIFYYKQSINIGANKNFQFVLERSKGFFFMWAADDDSFDSTFIEKAVMNIGVKSAIFCYYTTLSLSGENMHHTIISGIDDVSKFEAMRSFLLNRTPSLIYALFKRNDINWYLTYKKEYDWSDCFFIQRIILSCNGYSVLPSYLFTATSRGNDLMSVRNRKFEYKRYLIESTFDIIKSSLSVSQQLKILFLLIDVTIRSYSVLEKMNFFQILLFRLYNKIVPHVKYQRLF